MDTEASLRRQLCEAGKRLYAIGLIGANEGNLSVRLDQTSLLCTPTGGCKGRLEPDHIVHIGLDATPLNGGVPSTEIALHTKLYELRPDCSAVVHAHPIHATALSLVGKTIPPGFLPEADYVLGPVALVPFGLPGTSEVSDGIGPFADGHKTFVLSHHGAATIGRGIEDAVDRMEVLERVCRTWAIACSLGDPEPLPVAQQNRLAHVLDGRIG